ncbi:energy transducer TonB [Flavobacteriaceae bacterium]|nr:energy transducer TonB [Flavobacteriaceae bacterium]MDC1060946.1 energy transducer TonB [Flavobacteriaceae bacterium]
MKYLKTPHERKSAVLTSIIAALLLLLLSFVGLQYFDPPISYGMEVNFGTSTQGKGKIQPTKAVASQPKPRPQQLKPTPIEPQAEKAVSKVLTQEEESIPVVKKEPKKVSPKEETPKKAEPKKIEKKTPPTPPKPTVAASTKSILSNVLNAKKQEGEEKAGEGNDTVAGDKGKTEGNPYANSYYNKAGLGGNGKGFGLNGRNLQSNGAVTQECNEEGIVVVRITVNQQGQVMTAEPGVKGSTNVHPCLLEPAKKTAFLHRWFPDNNAPTIQTGFVVINFKLSE